MPISTRPLGAAHVVNLTGRLDATVAFTVRDELMDLVDAGRTRLLIDLSGVTFMDSTGLSALVAALKMAQSRGGDMVLIKLNPTIRSVLEITRLHRVFKVCDDEAEAAKQL